jgi:nucleoid-associated protein YgaU
MIRKLFITSILVFSMLSQFAWASPEFTDNYPERYTVVKGDTLWDISGKFLKSPWLWPEIWHANPQVSNPHLIYPGDIIGLVYIDGQPRITTLQAGPENGVVKLSPKVKAMPISAAIPTIPLDAIASFLSQNRIIEPDDMNSAPYVLIGKEQHLLSAAGDTVFARGDVGDVDRMAVYRSGKDFIDPETNEYLGLEAKAIATTAVSAVNNEVISLTVLRSNEEIRQGDRLLHTEDRVINSTYMPSKPDFDVRGKMISVNTGVGNIGQYNVVVVNRGERDGLIEGNVLAIYKNGGIVRDPFTKEKIELPSERAGIMMIFRVFDKLSYGLILKATRPLAVMDEVRTP